MVQTEEQIKIAEMVVVVYKLSEAKKKLIRRLQNGERIHWRIGANMKLDKMGIVTLGEMDYHTPCTLTEAGKAIEV